jgi:hypothetical protein
LFHGCYTKASGADADLPFRVEPGQRLNVPPSLRPKDRSLLYASIPTDPRVGFAPLVKWLTMSYQAAHADVLLNLVLDPAIDVYSFGNLKDAVLSAQGFDVAEIDTVFLKWLKDEELIGPIRITGDEPWPVVKQAVTIDGQTYGVPSWICSDFLFSIGGGLTGVKTFADLQAYVAKSAAARRALVGDLGGTWTIPAAYIQAYVQSHAATSASDAVIAPIDAAVIARMVKFGTYCALSNSGIDGTFHSARDGAVEQAFVTEPAATDDGFFGEIVLPDALPANARGHLSCSGSVGRPA